MSKNRNEYMKEYKRRKRAEKKAKELQPADYYLSMSCITYEEAEKRGSGACNGWACVSCCDAFVGEDIDGVFDFLARLDRKSNVYVDNLSVWGRFIVSEAMARGFVASSGTSTPHTYRIVVDAYGKWIALQVNVNGTTAYVKDFHGIIKTSINEAQKAFLDSDALLLSNLDVAECMQQVHCKFNDAVKDLAGAKITASTIAGYAKKMLYVIYGDGCERLGYELFKQDYPDLPREIMDDIRESKLYRSGLNYMPKSATAYRGECFVYDRRSFYPFIYSNFALPYGKVYKREYLEILEARKTLDNFDDEYYIIYDIDELEAEIYPGGVPCIQIINSPTQTQYLEKIKFFGECKFMLDSNDLEALKENYEIKTLSVNYCYVWRKKVNPNLAEFGKRLYGLKQYYQDDARGVVAKYLINSITGQFGANPYKPETVIENGKYTRRELIYKGEIGYLSVAACINSIGRKILARDIRTVGLKYLYGDTDSIITAQRSELLEKLSGDGMGQYSRKHYENCVFMGRKCYGLKMFGHGWKWTIAGASPEMLEKLDAEKFKPGETLTGGVTPKIYDNLTVAFKEREYTIAKNGRVW